MGTQHSARNVVFLSAVRTPFGTFGGALKDVTATDLTVCAAKAALQRAKLDPTVVQQSIFGNVLYTSNDSIYFSRHVALKAGCPVESPALTVNRLCGSGLDAVAIAARAIAAGEADLMIAGGVESMSRAPFVVSKAQTPFARDMEFHDTTIGWRFVNPVIKEQYGIDSMPETAENVAEQCRISRADQDAFALRSQQRAAAAQANGNLAQ